MRTWTTAAAVVAAAALGAVGPARADDDCGLVRGFYAHYLHRDADEYGLANWVGALRRGAPPEDVAGAILGSDEYYRLHGCTPEGFAVGLYEDVLGREPGWQEVQLWVHVLCRCGDRCRVAHQFLCAAQVELANTAAAAGPPPVPSYDPPPVPVPPSPAVYSPRSDEGRPHVFVQVRLGR